MGQHINQLVVAAFVFVLGCPVSDVGQVVFGEQLDRVVPEASFQSVQASFAGGVSAQFKQTWLVGSLRFDRWRKIGRLEEDGFDSGHQTAIRNRRLVGGFPVSVVQKGFPHLGLLFAGGESDHIDELIVCIVCGHEVADVFDAVFFEQLHGVIAETTVQGIELAFAGIVGAHLVAQFIGSR